MELGLFSVNYLKLWVHELCKNQEEEHADEILAHLVARMSPSAFAKFNQSLNKY